MFGSAVSRLKNNMAYMLYRGKDTLARTFFFNPGSWLTGSYRVSCREKSFMALDGSSYYVPYDV